MICKPGDNWQVSKRVDWLRFKREFDWLALNKGVKGPMCTTGFDWLVCEGYSIGDGNLLFFEVDELMCDRVNRLVRLKDKS